MPLCAHQSTRKKAFDWVPDANTPIKKDQQLLKRIDKLISEARAQANEENKAAHRQASADWKERRAADKKRRSAANNDRSAPAGMDSKVEAPPMDARPWCTACLTIKAFNNDENVRVRTAEDNLQKKKNPTQRENIYNVNPLSHDNQHTPMAPDSFNQGSDHQHIFQGPLGGPYTHSIDALTNGQWDLFTQTGFQTYPHHDGSGMSTWVRICEGCKVWAPLILRLPDKSFFSQQDLFDVLNKVLQPAPSVEFQKHSQSLCMFLLPDDVL